MKNKTLARFLQYTYTEYLKYIDMTLKDFIYTLNQDYDVLVAVFDYMTENELMQASWKTDIRYFEEFKETLADKKVECFTVGTTKQNNILISVFVL